MQYSAGVIVTFLTDFGVSDAYVGVMKGVVLGIASQVTLVDITHDVPAGAIATGAYHLLTAYPYFPPGTTHVAVVDPGVGTVRRPIGIRAAGQYFVGPDNGLFGYLLEVEPGARVVHLSNASLQRHPVSDTFHGRDIFAPAGAALAMGTPFESLGPEIDDPIRLPGLRPLAQGEERLEARVLHIDRFGNVVTSVTRNDLWPGAGSMTGWRVQIGDTVVREFRREYAGVESGVVFAVWGSAGFLEVSCNGSAASALIGARIGDPVAVVREPGGTGG